MSSKFTFDRIGTKTTRVRRTIGHSPDFSGPQTTTDDGRPTRSMPAGGYMTG